MLVGMCMCAPAPKTGALAEMPHSRLSSGDRRYPKCILAGVAEMSFRTTKWLDGWNACTAQGGERAGDRGARIGAAEQFSSNAMRTGPDLGLD